jgi:alkane 1-monooxygenase
MFQSVASAWHLENERLRARGARVLSWQNEMIRLTFFQVAFVAAAGLLFGPVAMGGLLLAALTGALLLETVNYIEHYGLLRRQLPDGRYERVQPHHSWNSNHPLGRIVLFDLTRHADHHANARRKYQVLRHFDDAPQLPMGYPGMILLALVPPLFFAIMNPRVTGLRRDAERNAPSAEPLAA